MAFGRKACIVPRMIFRALLLLGFLLIAPTSFAANDIALPQDQSAAVILTYYRIGDDENVESVRRDQFQSHIDELTEGDYTVLPLSQIVAEFQSGDPQPPHTVAITFDGGHHSIIDTAAPVLLERNLPFTVFVATDLLDAHNTDAMTWDNLHRLSKNKNVTIGLHPAAYARLSGQKESEITRQINKAKARVREELGIEPTLFAYPFGDISASYYGVLKKQGFTAAFGQQSGVGYAGADMLALPRFSITAPFAALDRFTMTANALPLPVTAIAPTDFQALENPPLIGFTVDPALAPQIKDLSCFASGQTVAPEVKHPTPTRVELRFPSPLDTDHLRINCTLPAPKGEDENLRWRWFGMMIKLPAPALQKRYSVQ